MYLLQSLAETAAVSVAGSLPTLDHNVFPKSSAFTLNKLTDVFDVFVSARVRNLKTGCDKTDAFNHFADGQIAHMVQNNNGDDLHTATNENTSDQITAQARETDGNAADITGAVAEGKPMRPISEARLAANRAMQRNLLVRAHPKANSAHP
jgi:hypothetical protein